jgi:transposase
MISGMGRRFVSPARDQGFLLPPDMREWLPEDHPVWVLLDAVEQFDLTAFENAYRLDGRSRPPYAPAMMVALLLWAYAHGERSSRVIEGACLDRVPFRVIVGGLRIDHSTICRFRKDHEKALADLHVQVLALLGRAGMVRLGRLSLDGTKIAADASWSANRTADQLGTQIGQLQAWLRAQVEAMLAEADAADADEDAVFGPDRRGDELPVALRRQRERLNRLTEGKRQLDEEAAAAQAAQAAKVQAWAQRKAAGEPTGRKPNPTARTTTRNGKPPRRNTTDPDARVMKTKHHLVIGYNAQAVVTDDQVIVGADLSQEPVDATLLPDLLDTTIDQATAAGLDPTPTSNDSHSNDSDTGHASHVDHADSDGDDVLDHDDSPDAAMDVLLADAGYASEKAHLHAEDKGVRLYAPRHKNIDPRTSDPCLDPIDPAKWPASARGQQRLATPQGKNHYKHRGRTVEPAFGQIKTIQNLTRFARRGYTAARSEWLFSCAVHNLRKYINRPAASPLTQPA